MTHYICVGLGTFLFQYFMLSAIEPKDRPGSGTIVINFLLSLFLWPLVLGLMVLTGNLQRKEEAQIKKMIEEAYAQVGMDLPDDEGSDATVLAFPPPKHPTGDQVALKTDLPSVPAETDKSPTEGK